MRSSGCHALAGGMAASTLRMEHLHSGGCGPWACCCCDVRSFFARALHAPAHAHSLDNHPLPHSHAHVHCMSLPHHRKDAVLGAEMRFGSSSAHASRSAPHHPCKRATLCTTLCTQSHSSIHTIQPNPFSRLRPKQQQASLPPRIPRASRGGRAWPPSGGGAKCPSKRAPAHEAGVGQAVGRARMQTWRGVMRGGKAVGVGG